MKRHIFGLIIITISSIILGACGGGAVTQEQPVTEPSAQPPLTNFPSNTEPDAVAILVLDDFYDELGSDAKITTDQYNQFRQDFEKQLFTPNDNCVYTIQGQAAITGRGAAAITGRGADGLPIALPLPAPHGVIVFDELRSIVSRQPTNIYDSGDTGKNIFGSEFEWLPWIEYYTTSEGDSIALVSVDTSDYTTKDIKERLEKAMLALNKKGYSNFIVNMSFVLLPCPDLGEEINFDAYKRIIDSDSDLEYLRSALSELQTNYENGNIDLASVNLILGFEPDFGPLRLNAYYINQPDFNSSNFGEVLKSSDPLREFINEYSAKDIIIPVAAAGNEGLPYPFAPAMWNEVLSVGSPIDDKNENGLLVSNYFDATGKTSKFKTNIGEVSTEGCTNYLNTSPSQRIPGTSFAAPKVSYLAALYLLQGGTVDSCTSSPGITPTVTYPSLTNKPLTVLGYAEENGRWENLNIFDASTQYCSAFPASVDLQISCPASVTPESSITEPALTESPACVNNSQFVIDVTIPDNTPFAVGTPFTKTWSLLNSGNCTWDSTYTFDFISGEQMGGTSGIPFTTTTVAPGEIVEITISLIAPSASGTYQGQWQIKDSSGMLFGDKPYVQIVVP